MKDLIKTIATAAFLGAFGAPALAQEDGSVVQHFDQQNPETGEWSVWFEGLYVRRETDPNPPDGQ